MFRRLDWFVLFSLQLHGLTLLEQQPGGARKFLEALYTQSINVPQSIDARDAGGSNRLMVPHQVCDGFTPDFVQYCRVPPCKIVVALITLPFVTA